MNRRCLLLAVALILFATLPLRADGDSDRLFAVLRRTTPTKIDPDKLDDLIRQLGNPDFERREKASRELVACGRSASDRLRAALDHTDAEIRRRARVCLSAIDASLDPDAAYVATMQLLKRQPAGAAAVLLEFLPYADAETAEEIWQGVTPLAVRDGKLDPAFRAALNDPEPARRALAALLVGRYGTEAERPAVSERLTDTDAEVRLRAAQGLLAVRDPAGVPALIALLKDGPLEQAWQAEELLHYLAGSAAPEPTVGAGDTALRQKVHAAWLAWWRAEGPQFDPRRLERETRRPGLVLVGHNSGLWVYGCDGKSRWQMPTNVANSSKVQVLPGLHFLTLDGDGPTLTERDAAGKVLWRAPKLDDEYFVAVQRLANGNTFLATEDDLREIDKDGKPVARVPVTDNPNGTDLMMFDAFKRRNGSVVIRTNTGVAELDGATGQLLVGGDVPHFRAIRLGSIRVLADGRCLLADIRNGRVLEVDTSGTIFWEQTAPGAVSVDALSNGNVLVGAQRDDGVYEMTRDGRHVWEAAFQSRVLYVHDICGRVRLGFERPQADGFDLNSVANRAAQLQDKDVTARRRAAGALAVHGPKALPAVPDLLAALSDKDPDVVQRVRHALFRVGPDALPALLETVQRPSTDEPTRAGSWNVLIRLGPAARPVLTDMVKIMRDSRAVAGDRQAAARVLGAMGTEAATALPALLEALRSDDDGLRAVAAPAVAAAGQAAAESMKGLIAALRDAKHPQGAVAAAQALRTLGAGAAPARPDLLAVLQDRKYAVEIRSAAARAFTEMGADAQRPALKPLTDLFSDATQPDGLRVAIAETLGGMGAEAAPALPALYDALRNPSMPAAVADSAVKAVGALGADGPRVLSLLVNEGSTRVKLGAIILLANYGGQGSGVLPALLEAAAQDGDPEVRQRAEAAVHNLQDGGRKYRVK